MKLFQNYLLGKTTAGIWPFQKMLRNKKVFKILSGHLQNRKENRKQKKIELQDSE